MTFTSGEHAYLRTQRTGQLATIGADGGPQNKPVGFSCNSDLGTIDIHGFDMEKSQKFRNAQADPRVAFVADDATGEGAEGMGFLEIRGVAETASEQASTAGDVDHIIRIWPRRIIGWNVAPSQPGLTTRDIRAKDPFSRSDPGQFAGAGPTP